SIKSGGGRTGSSTPATASSDPRAVSSRQAPQERCGESGGMAAPHLRQNLTVVILIVRPFPSLKYCTEIPDRLRAQRGDEVAQFIFNLCWRCHRVRDFLTQQLSVTLSQSMEGLFDRVLGHAKLARDFRLRGSIRFVREQCVQPLVQRRVS